MSKKLAWSENIAVFSVLLSCPTNWLSLTKKGLAMLSLSLQLSFFEVLPPRLYSIVESLYHLHQKIMVFSMMIMK